MPHYRDKGVDYDKALLVSGADRDEVSETNPLPVSIENLDITIEEATFNQDIDKLAGNAINVGSGASGTGTARVIHASDDPAVSGIGGTSDAAVVAGAAGSLTAQVRRLTTDLDAVKTAAQIIDDWDSSDRCKVIEKVDPVVTNATGAAAIATSYAPAAPAYLENITVHLSAAPTTAGSLTIKLNANDGAAYDTVLLSQSMVGLTDFMYQPDRPILIESGDAIDVAYANADTKTYGLRIVTRVMS